MTDLGDFMGTGLREKTRQDISIDDMPLKKTYNKTKVVILPRNPNSIYTYWDLNNSLSTDIDMILRVFKLSEDYQEKGSFDIPVNNFTKKYYINIKETNFNSYYVELGFKNRLNKFVSLAKSNKITLPKGDVSENIDEEWKIDNKTFKKLENKDFKGISSF